MGCVHLKEVLRLAHLCLVRAGVKDSARSQAVRTRSIQAEAPMPCCAQPLTYRPPTKALDSWWREASRGACENPTSTLTESTLHVGVYIHICSCVYIYTRICTSIIYNGMCEHLPVSRVVMYSLSLLGCFACMYRACRSATYWIKRRLESYRSYRSLKSATSPIL